MGLIQGLARRVSHNAETGIYTPRMRHSARLMSATQPSSSAVREHYELAQSETLCGSSRKECDAIIDLSSACGKSGVDSGKPQSLALVPLKHHTVPAQEVSIRKRGAVAENATAKQEPCERAVR